MKKILIAALAATAIAAPATAATQGSLSSTSSQGSLVLTTNVPNLVRISGLDDITINVTDAALNNQYFSRQDADDQFCVYSNNTQAGLYKLSIQANAESGTLGGGPFAMTGGDGGNDEIRYSVWLTDDLSNQFKSYAYNGTQYSYQTTAGGQTRPATTDCSDIGGTNANIKVGVDNAAILAATAGAYTDTITLTVTPL